MPTRIDAKRKILIVDDDVACLSIVGKALAFEGFKVEQASSGQEAIEKMNSWRPHLVLLDINMPGLSGMETLKILRVRDEYVSVIFVSGRSSTEDVTKGLDAGADDYVRKPFDVLELLARVRAQLRIKDLNDNLKIANGKLKELVDIDDLTGLYNMRSLYKKLDFELDRARRYKRTICVMMMDMDYFKKVNDHHDHLFGSFVLTQVGKMIRDNIRKVDFAARYGGDEFLIVLTEIDFIGAQIFAERLREGIERRTFKSDRHEIQLTASIGCAVVMPSQINVDSRGLVRWADQALYRAKQNGRNRVEFFSESQK
ncbi:MAG: diguanylate cyclase [Bdellovibrionales bacterium]|nr:diguanylate cyclase [Bdellovibrionales bacterium]